MRLISGVVVFSAGLAALPFVAFAEVQPVDPLSQGQVIELSFGLFAPLNTLQDTLTTPNGGGAQLQGTDLLDFGTGGRIGLSYSRPWGENARLVFGLTGARSAGTERVAVGRISETFPGSYDDGFNLPANWSVDTEITTRVTMLTIGRDWALNDAWRVSAGLQAGQASQDLSGLVRAPDGELFRTLTTRSENTMYGVFGGVSHYSALSETLGLRLSGSVGVLQNEFEYQYVNVTNAVGVPPAGQNISASESGTAVSTRVSARLERRMSDNGTIIFEAGYEGLHGIGNGADTFLDVNGTRSVARIDSDRIGAAYLSLGYAYRF